MAAALLLGVAGLAHPQALSPPESTPGFAALEAAGARIGRIRVITRDVFDTDDPREDKLLFRWANALHIQTRPGVIERALLFRSGEPLSLRLLEETERLLRSNRYLADVEFRVAAHHDGVVDIDVITRDTWTLEPGFGLGRSGGASSSRLRLGEYNLFGTGMTVSLGRTRNVDRQSKEFRFSNQRAFGTWTALSYSHATSSDGRSDAVSVVRPFHALDARWSAGITASKNDRLDASYAEGRLVSQYRHREVQAEAFGGWSAGLIDGWVQRYSAGLALLDDQFAVEPGLQAPARLPQDRRLVSPFVRYELLEDRYERELNRNLIGRPEFFELGLRARLQLGRASTRFGSSRDAWLYAASVSRGFEPAPGVLLMAAASVSGQALAGQATQQRAGVQAQYYLPQGKRWLFYAAASADLLTRGDPGDALLLGGDNGLRGYPLRYQSGARRALFTFEERFHTDLYAWRLFRLGGAAFVDIGRAWGGGDRLGVNRVRPGWLGDVGIGLRIVNTRSAFSNVLHLDLAMPLNAPPEVSRLQFLVNTKTSF